MLRVTANAVRVILTKVAIEKGSGQRLRRGRSLDLHLNLKVSVERRRDKARVSTVGRHVRLLLQGNGVVPFAVSSVGLVSLKKLDT